MKKQIVEIELVEVDGEILTVRRGYDKSGYLQTKLEKSTGEMIAQTNSRLNAFGIFGSVAKWVAFHMATKEQRKKDALENMTLAETPQEIREAKDTLAVIAWGEAFDKECDQCRDVDGVPILGGIGWCE